MLRMFGRALVPGQKPVGVNASTTDIHGGGRPKRKHVVSAIPTFERVVVQYLTAPSWLLPFEVGCNLQITPGAAKGAGDLVEGQLVSVRARPFP
jgi:hypothetical protein